MPATWQPTGSGSPGDCAPRRCLENASEEQPYNHAQRGNRKPPLIYRVPLPPAKAWVCGILDDETLRCYRRPAWGPVLWIQDVWGPWDWPAVLAAFDAHAAPLVCIFATKQPGLLTLARKLGGAEGWTSPTEGLTRFALDAEQTLAAFAKLRRIAHRYE